MHEKTILEKIEDWVEDENVFAHLMKWGAYSGAGLGAVIGLASAGLGGAIAFAIVFFLFGGFLGAMAQGVVKLGVMALLLALIIGGVVLVFFVIETLWGVGKL